MNRIILAAAAAITAISCSTIKEDRGPCPCKLTVIYGDSIHTTEGIALSGWNEDRLFTKKADTGDLREGLSYFVPKGNVAVCAAMGLRESNIDGHKVIIPDGHGADSLRCHFSMVDCRSEFVSDTVHLHKQFAAITFIVEGVDIDGESPFGMNIKANTAGIDMIGLQPLTGKFRTTPRRISPGTYLTEVPRQADKSLTLELTPELTNDDKPIKELPIGSYLENIGYSWLKEDLEDITIRINYAMETISIVVDDWQEGYEFEFKL